MTALARPLSAHAGVAALILALAAGCTTGESTYEAKAEQAGALQAARDRLHQELRDCGTRYNYDPNDPSLPERGVTPNELEWRQCAYDAARNYTSVNTPLALDFATLIDEDQKMTQALATGQMTRSERRERLRPLIAAVHEKEVNQIEAIEADQARKDELARQTIEGLRGFD